MNKFYAIFMLIFLIGFTVGPGHCIKCFNCDSTSNKDCADLKKNSGIIAETCTPSIMASTTGNWLADLTRIEYFGGKEITVPMYCQKIVAFYQNNDSITYRGCQLDAGKTDPCQIAYDKAGGTSGIKIAHCSICKEDECNRSVNLLGGRASVTLATGVTLLTMALTNKIIF